MFLLLSLACVDPKPGDTADTGDDTADTGGDTADTGGDTADTGADTGDDTGDDTADTGDDTGDTGVVPGTLDRCVAAAEPLTETWSWSDDSEGTFEGLDWQDGVLVALENTHVLLALSAPADGTSPSDLRRTSMEISWTDMRVVGPDQVVLVGGSGLALWSPAADDLAFTAWPGVAEPTSISVDRSGLLVASADAAYGFGLDLTGPVRLPVELDRITAVGAAGGVRWAAGVVGDTPAVVRDSGAGFGDPVTVTGVFGDPTAIEPRVDGGAQVAGGPEGYGWVATMDTAPALLGSTQFESPALPTLRRSPGSAYGWAFFRGFGLMAFDDGGNYVWMTEGAPITDVFVDPTGSWVVVGTEDGRLVRYGCELR